MALTPPHGLRRAVPFAAAPSMPRKPPERHYLRKFNEVQTYLSVTEHSIPQHPDGQQGPYTPCRDLQPCDEAVWNLRLDAISAEAEPHGWTSWNPGMQSLSRNAFVEATKDVYE